MIWVILIIVALVFLFIMFKGRKKPYLNKDLNTLVLTGAPGTGKTLTGVKIGLKRYKKALKFVNKENRKIKRKNLLLEDDKKVSLLPIPQVYSNFPIDYGFVKSVPIKKEHLLLKEKLVENSIVILDEFGSIASQYSYNDEEVRINLSEFTRMFRQYLGNKSLLICIDQSIERISKEVRMSVGSVYEILDKKTLFNKFYFLKVVKYENYIQQGLSLNQESIFKIKGVFSKKRFYSDRAFKLRYDLATSSDGLVHTSEYELNLIRLDDQKSNLDILLDKEVKKLYQKEKEKNKK